MSSYVTVAQAIQEIENWLRLATLLHEPLKEALLAFLHNDYKHNYYVGLPRNPTALNTEIRKQQNTINRLVKKGVLKQDQVDTLLPPNSTQTDSQTFDITLIIVLIINFTTLPPPKNGWNKKLAAGDISPAAFVILARDWRNRLLHADAKSIDLNELNLRWNEGEKIVIGLGFTTYNMNALRTRPLDVTNNLVVQSLSFFSKKILNELATVGQLKKNISKHDTALNLHVTTLSSHGTTLTSLDTALKKHDNALTEHDNTLTTHNNNLTTHETILSSHRTTLNDHDTVIDDHSDVLDHHSNILTDHNDFLQENKECILRLDQVVECLKEEHEFIKKTLPTHKEPGTFCNSEALEIISNNIGQQKDQLLTRLGLSLNDNQKDLTEQLKTVEWARLSLELERLERVDLVSDINKKTLVTEGIQLASSKLRCQYAKEKITSLAHEPLMGDQNEVHYQYDEDLYTDLAVLKATEVEKEINNSDREALMEQKLLKKESIELHDLFQKEDEAVFVRAVGGMGKTTMLEMYTRKWARHQLGLDFPLEFVFFFSCREINQMYGKVKSIEDLFKDKYPDIFDKTTLKDLEPVADRILLVVDGLDELQDVYDCSQKKANKNGTLTPFQIVFDLINTQGRILKGHKSIACGRPKACDFLKRKIMDLKTSNRTVIKIKTVEVCGFKEEDVEKYIHKFFNGNIEKINRVKEIISVSHNLKVMSTVPVFAWVICNVYSEDLITKPLNTCTELYMYACFVFLRKHLQGVSTQGYDNLLDMLNDNNVIDCIYSLMTLSVKTYMQNQVLFSEEEVRQLNCPVHLEQTGLIVNYNRGEMREPIYQYKHLVLQEFLTGLYLCVTKGISPYLTNRELSSCAPVIFGIGRLLKENDFFIKFFQRLSNLHTTKSTIFRRILQPYRTWVFNNYLTRNTLEIPDCMVGPDSLLINSTMPECQEFMTSLYEGRLKIECPFSTVTIKSDLNEIDKRNVVFLIDHLNLIMKIPECMKGPDCLIIDTKNTECNNFIKLVYKTKAKVECPFSEFEMFNMYMDTRNCRLDHLLHFVKHLNLALKIPSCMVGIDTLIIDADLPECRRHLKAAYFMGLKPVYRASSIEIHSETRLDLIYEIRYIIKSSNLKLNIPSCMLGTEWIIIDFGIHLCRLFVNFIYHSKLQVECPYSTVDVEGTLLGTEQLIVTTFIEVMELNLKIPSSMMGPDALIIDAKNPRIKNFLKLIPYVKGRFQKCQLKKVEITSNLRDADIDEVVIFLEENNINILKLPDCMRGTDSLLIKDESLGFLKFFTKSNFEVDEIPFTKFEICDSLDSNEYRFGFYTWERLVDRIKLFITRFNLTLQIPDCMLGSNGLVIDMSNRECANFIRHVNSLQVEVKCSLSKFETICGHNHDSYMLEEIHSFIEHLKFKGTVT
ncbi:uncharacterized protein [Clytia hemisphaerica]|uniref:NACHT domain-containing protein n=1 Tax=Clytia hemisphaerica TaxID=252671 RepID=A0A7M5UI56_9CNID